MRRKAIAWLAWSYFGLIVVLVLWDLIQVVSSRPGYDSVFAFLDLLIWGSNVGLGAIPFAFVGALIVSRQPQNTVGWLLMVTALAAIMSLPAAVYLSRSEIILAEPSALLLLAAWLANIAWLPLIYSVFFILQLFPTGRPLSPRWRWLIVLGLAMCAFFAIWTAFETQFGLGEFGFVPNPIGFLQSDAFPMSIWLAVFLFFVLASGVSLFLRYRRSGRIERTQMKWLLYACGLLLAVFIPGVWLSDAPPPLSNIWSIMLALALMAIPAAIAIAILNYRLWDIDVIIRRTLVYAVLTGLLALIYFGSVVVMGNLFTAVSGQQSPLAIVVATLLIAAIFTPLRRRVQAAIDRRFYRRKYDAAQALAAFAATARDEVDIEALTAELLQVVQTTMQPQQVSLWLKPSQNTPSNPLTN